MTIRVLILPGTTLPMIFNKYILKKMAKNFSHLWESTSQVKFRTRESIQYAFFYQNFVSESNSLPTEITTVNKTTHGRGYKYLYNYIDDNFDHTKEKLNGLLNYFKSKETVFKNNLANYFMINKHKLKKTYKSNGARVKTGFCA